MLHTNLLLHIHLLASHSTSPHNLKLYWCNLVMLYLTHGSLILTPPLMWLRIWMHIQIILHTQNLMIFVLVMVRAYKSWILDLVHFSPLLHLYCWTIYCMFLQSQNHYSVSVNWLLIMISMWSLMEILVLLRIKQAIKYSFRASSIMDCIQYQLPLHKHWFISKTLFNCGIIACVMLQNLPYTLSWDLINFLVIKTS
jgi:hypothetical protein